MVTYIQMAELITTMTKVGGKFEYKEVSQSSIVNKQYEENLRKTRRVSRQIEAAIKINDQPTSSQQADQDTHEDEQMDDAEDPAIKDEIEQTSVHLEMRGPWRNSEMPSRMRKSSAICLNKFQNKGFKDKILNN